MENTPSNNEASSGTSALDDGLGRCCYGGVKPKTACASCGAWEGIRFVEAKATGNVPPNYACEGCYFVDYPALCAKAIDGDARAVFGGDCDERDVIYVEAPNA